MTQAPRVYGTEPDSPATGPQPGHTYRELTGGPLDGQLLEVSGWTDEQITTDAASPSWAVAPEQCSRWRPGQLLVPARPVPALVVTASLSCRQARTA